MVNRSFSRLSKEEKEAKLQAALRCMTDKALTENELRAVSHAVRLSCQYFIRVHHNNKAFFSDLMYHAQRQTQFIIGSCPVSQRNVEIMVRTAAEAGDPITAVVDLPNRKNGIYILIPEQRNKKEYYHDK